MATATITPIAPTRPRNLLDDCQRAAMARLPAALQGVLAQADDVLFKLANGADNSKRQDMYFDAMRELRLKRDEIEQRFRDHFASRAGEKIASVTKPPARGAALDFGGELSLVSLDEVEEDLAVTNLATSLRSRSGRDLSSLEARLAAVMKLHALKETDNPFGPETIGDALRHGCAVLDAGIEVRITLYKLTDKIAGHSIAALFGELNQLLLDAGVLPSLGGPVVASRPSRTRVIIESGEQSVEATGGDVYSTLAQLMSGQFVDGGGAGVGGMGGGGAAHGGMRAGGLPMGHGPGGGGAGGAAGMGGMGMPGMSGPGLPGIVGVGAAAAGGGGMGFGGAPGAGGAAGLGGMTAGGFPTLFGSDDSGAGPGFVSAPILVDTLTQIQRAAGGGEVAGGVAAMAGDLAAYALGNVNVLRELRASGAVGQMAPSHDMTLEIVSVLFDYILEDRSIPDAIKALIGRLQIPMLKVAILDKDLFSKKSHPARRLLDAFAHAAVGWYEGLPQSDALYDKMEQAVRRIVAEFDDDVALFAAVLADFNAFIERETQSAADRAESSSRSLRTREQIALAKMAADDALRARLTRYETREFIQDFLFDYWRQLMIIRHVEHGAESPEWTDLLGTADELVWSVQPKTTPEERKQLSARLPRMLKSIKAGMMELEMPPPECSKFLSMLASVHVVVIKSIEESSIAARKLTQPRPVTDVSTRPADFNDPASEEFIKRGLARLFERKAGDAPIELDIDFSAFETPAEVIPDPTATPQLAGGADDVASLQRHVEQVTSLDLGDWVEFTAVDGSRERGRFTWISEATGRYLFTNRQGDMMRESTLLELAQLFRDGRGAIIKSESDPLFDRILGDLLDRLEAQAAA